MTTISTGLNTAVRGCFAAIQGQIYFTNNFDPVKVWDGLASSMANAGITGPAAAIGSVTSTAAGNTSAGDHRIRYRFKNSKTGYVSNPSPEATVTVAGGAEALTYNIGNGGSGAPIIRSTDSKADTIIVELTAITGKEWYVAATALNSAASVVVNIADSSLIQQLNADATYGSAETLDTFSHEVPPVGTIIVFYKGRAFIGGDEAYTVSVTANSTTTLSGTGFSTKWVGRLIRVQTSDTVAYEITAATTTSLTIASAYPSSGTYASASVYSRFPNRVYYSRIGYPESFYAIAFARDLLQNKADTITGILGRQDAMYIFGRFSAERLVFQDDPGALTSEIHPIQGSRGVFNQRCLVEYDGEIFAFDRLGIYIVSDSPRHISAPIDDLLTELVDYSASAKFHGCYDPRDRVVMFFFVRSGDTQPKYAACVEIDTGRWWIDHFYVGITASSVVPTSDGQVRCMLGDENGYTWFFGIDGSFDGVPPSTSTVLTVTGSPTTTSIPVTQTLSTSPSLAGVVLYNPANGDARVIASNTSSTITLASALSGAPTVGASVYIGAIAWEMRTKWRVAPKGQEWKQRPVYLRLKLYPGTATGSLRVFIYADFSATPTTVTETAADLWPDGVTITTSTTYVDIDLDGGSGDGYVSVPLQADFKRALQARITSVRPDGELRLLDADFAFYQGSEAPKEGE